MKLKEIQNLIKFVAKSGASEVSLEMENVKITVKTSTDTPKVVVQEPIVIPQQSQVSTPQPSKPPTGLSEPSTSNSILVFINQRPLPLSVTSKSVVLYLQFESTATGLIKRILSYP